MWHRVHDESSKRYRVHDMKQCAHDGKQARHCVHDMKYLVHGRLLFGYIFSGLKGEK